MDFDFLVTNGAVVCPGGVCRGTVAVSRGKIAAILSPDIAASGRKTIDASGKYVLPGVVEPHTHIGLYRPFEDDLPSETRSAAFGGVTTVFHFNQTSGSYSDVLPTQIAAIEGNAYTDVAYNGVINNPSHLDEIEYLMENGITSFKFFMAYKGDEGKALNLFGSDEATLLEGFRRIGSLGGLPMVHAENQAIYLGLTPKFKNRNDLAAFSEARPELCEDLDIRTACRLAEYAESDLYIVHLGYGKGVDIVEEFRGRGQKIFLETCPHYLTVDMSGEGLEEPLSIKVMPPVKNKASREALWRGLAAGKIQTIGTDHCSNMREKKLGLGDVWTAMAGFPGMATRLPLMLSEGVNKGRLTIEQVAEVTSTNPARLLGVYPRKGAIVTGADADLAIVDLDLEKVVDAADLCSASDYSPWQGWSLKGWPVTTILRGEVIADESGVCGSRGYGQYVSTSVARGR